MRTVIYLDVLLLVNFVVGAAFLLAAGLLCGACCSPLRLVGGAGTAAVSSLVLLAPTAPWPLALTYKGTTAALCVAAAYGWQGVRNTARLTAWFILLNLTLTGALLLPGAACNNLSFYLPVSPGLLLASTAGVCGGVQGVMHLLGRSSPACFEARLRVAGQSVELKALCDTGFHVQEPLSGRAVVLVRLGAVRLPEALQTYLERCLAGGGGEPRPEWGGSCPARPSRATVCCPPCPLRFPAAAGRRRASMRPSAIRRPRRAAGRPSSVQRRRRCWGNEDTMGGNLPVFQRFVKFLQGLWARLSWTGGAHYLSGGPGLPPPLTPEEEKDLLARMADGDPAARDALITHNLRLVVYLAKKYEGSGVPSEDMVSIGTIGLIKAVNTFTPERSIKLATYASRCIGNEILMYLRKSSNRRQEASIDEPLNIDGDGNELLLSDVLSSEENQVGQRLEQDAERASLRRSVEQLSPRERQIMELRFGLLDGVERTQKEVADAIGISQSYISRLEKRIIRQLREQLGE